MGYASPADVPISSSWSSHKKRNPPSSEPGTDYATAYGTNLRIAGNGVVSVIDTSNGGGEGRRLSIDLDDGRRVSYIHLDRMNAYVGMPVTRGQTGVIWSGASGNGKDWYYGPHVHVTLWERPGMSYKDSIDFEPHVGPEAPEPTPQTEDDDMPQFFEPNVIVWPNGWANAYDPQVYSAMKSYAANPNDPSVQWVRDTWVRESWAATDGIQKRQTDVIAAAIPDAEPASHSTARWVAIVVAIVLGLAADIPLIAIALELWNRTR